MQWSDLNTKSFQRFAAIKNTNGCALVWPEHKIVSTIISFQEHLLTCIGGTLTQNLFGEFKLSKMHIDMHWWDFTTKSFRRFSAVKNTYSHALMGPKHKIFPAICSYQEYLWTYIGGTLTENLFGDFQLSRILIDMPWWDLNTKSFRWISAIKNAYWHRLVGISHKIYSAVFRYQEYLSHATIGPEHKIFSAICSDQEYFWMCIGGTLAQSLFDDFQLSRILIDMHWCDLNTKSFRRFSTFKNTYWHALVGP